MNQYDDISQLVDRFLDGKTTLAEERRLEAFFMTHETQLGEMPEHLQIAAEMFRELHAMKSDAISQEAKHPAYKIKPNYHHWIKWAGVIAAACMVLCVVLISPSDTNPKLEEPTIKVAQLPEAPQPNIINSGITESKPTDNQTSEVPKINPIKRKIKSMESKPVQETKESVPDIRELHNEMPVQNGNVMLCGFNPNGNMLPMHTDVKTRAVMTECEMSILEEEFQMSERSRQTIEI